MPKKEKRARDLEYDSRGWNSTLVNRVMGKNYVNGEFIVVSAVLDLYS